MTKRTFRTTTSAFALLGALAAMPGAAWAQADDDASAYEPIIVTAQRRAEASVDVPITITSLGAEALATANVQELSDISKMTPGLRFDYSSGFVQPTIRGVGTAVVTSGGGGNVGIYVDGFYSPNPLGIDFQMMKVESIQVLKGPQGTLFGRNTTGGAILVQTAEPSTETGGAVKASYGRYNEARMQGYYTTGISDSVALDVEGMYARGDGWQRNISNGKRVGDFENWSMRLGLKADLSENVSVLLRYQHAAMDDPGQVLPSSYFDPVFGSGAPYFALPSQVTFKKNKVGDGTHPMDQSYFRSNTDVFQGTIKADLGFADLTSYTQFRDEKVNSAIEGDYSGTELYQLGLPNQNETFSQEFLLTSKPGSRLQWTAGLFHFSNTDTYMVYFDYFPGFGITNGRNDFTRFGSSTKTKGYAAFLDMTYEITPQLFFTAGGRYAHDQVNGAYWIEPFSFPNRIYVKDARPDAYKAVRKDHFTPRAVIRYKPNDQTSIYASFTKGYKAGLLDVGGGRGNYVRPEKITAYEVGAKYDNRGLSAEISGFYYDYKDLQVSLYKTGQAQILNAASSEIYGIDAQFRYEVTDNFTVNAGGAWVHARYKRFENAPVYVRCLDVNPTPFDPVTGCGINTFLIPEGRTLRNSTMQRTPEFTGNVGARYSAELAKGELVLSGNLFYSTKFYMGPSGIQFPQQAYETLSLRAQWTNEADNLSIALWGDNVTNSRYRESIQFGQPGIGVNWNQPVTYGVEVGVKF